MPSGVLEHVGQRLGDQPAVEVGHHRRLRQPLLEIDVGAPDPHEEHRLAHAIGEVVARRPRLRHAREGGELVDHALDVVDLADDRVGALVEHVLALDDVAAVAALEPLGGKLDRRQRILDLVGDAAGDVGPGGGALRGDEIGDVVERDDAAAVAAPRIAGDADVEDALAAVAQHRRLALMQAHAQRARLFPDQADASGGRRRAATDQLPARRRAAARRRRCRP